MKRWVVLLAAFALIAAACTAGDGGEPEPDALRDLEERQRELERELADLRERIRAQTS